MLDKLVNIRNLLTMIFGGIFLVFWFLYLIFGSGENKVTFLILSPIVSIITYVFVRISFKFMRVNGSNKFINFSLNFFLITGTIGLLIMIYSFIAEFPNGLYPTLGSVMSLIIAVLDVAKKY